MPTNSQFSAGERCDPARLRHAFAGHREPFSGRRRCGGAACTRQRGDARARRGRRDRPRGAKARTGVRRGEAVRAAGACRIRHRRFCRSHGGRSTPPMARTSHRQHHSYGGFLRGGGRATFELRIHRHRYGSFGRGQARALGSRLRGFGAGMGGVIARRPARASRDFDLSRRKRLSTSVNTPSPARGCRSPMSRSRRSTGAERAAPSACRRRARSCSAIVRRVSSARFDSMRISCPRAPACRRRNPRRLRWPNRLCRPGRS